MEKTVEQLFKEIKESIHQENQEGIKNEMMLEMVRFTHEVRRH